MKLIMKSNKKSNKYKLLISIIITIFIFVTAAYAATTYASQDVYYNNVNTTLTSADVQGAIDELADKYARNSICPSSLICIKKPPVKLGDYVSLTPTKSSYTTDTAKTGYGSTQTINPQELNLWRVISINNDGTVDIISEHVSGVGVSFQGQTGYQNLVGYLNVLASQYENSAYTTGSRHFGYNGQTEYITDTSKFTNPAPWTCSTGESCNPTESQGGGDELYTKDYDLVNTVLGTRVATKPSGTASYYWMASRRYYYSEQTYYSWDARNVNTRGSSSNYYLYDYDSSSFGTYSGSCTLRPILTLKSGLKYSGDGTESSPWQLSAS